MRESRDEQNKKNSDCANLSRSESAIKENDPYPTNPRLAKPFSTGLTHHEQQLVALNRILTNYWKFQSSFQVQESTESDTTQIYYLLSNSTSKYQDSNIQMEKILSIPGFDHFPHELKQQSYTPQPLRHKNLHKFKPKQVIPKTLTETAADATIPMHPEEGIPLEEEEDFGGDDYAKNPYSDEEKEEFDESSFNNEAF